MQIVYIPGEDNTVADALYRVPDGAFPGESIETSTGTFTIPGSSVNAVLSITTDPSVLHMIQDGYLNDDFCKKKSLDCWNLPPAYPHQMVFGILATDY